MSVRRHQSAGQARLTKFVQSAALGDAMKIVVFGRSRRAGLAPDCAALHRGLQIDRDAASRERSGRILLSAANCLNLH
jgi:hypothetical protein